MSGYFASSRYDGDTASPSSLGGTVADSSFLRGLTHDGLYTPEIKPHSIEKLRRHNYVASMFATSMKSKWARRAYLGLYSGAGRAQLSDTKEIIETTAMSVLRLRDPFTDYIFVDDDSRCTSALANRSASLPTAANTTIIQGDVNEKVDDIKRALPRYSKKQTLLSFCFVDPFDVGLKFNTIKALSTYQMDFLILLALGVDLRRNLRTYFQADADSRIADFIDCATWRNEYASSGKKITRIVLEKFDDAMVRLGYLSSNLAHPVKISGGGVLLYYLVYYSKHRLGLDFWKATLKGATPQVEFDLDI